MAASTVGFSCKIPLPDEQCTAMTSSRITYFLLIVLSTLSLAACVEDVATPALVDPTDFVTYVHPTGTFTLDLPPEWIISDTSSDRALNVEFSPPGSDDPLIGVYIISLNALNIPIIVPTGDPSITPNPNTTPIPPSYDLNSLANTYETNFYTFTDAFFKEVARDQQPDGSLRLQFVIDAPQGTSTHNDFIQIVGSYFVAMRTRIPTDHAQMRTISKVINTLEINQGSGWVSAGADTASRDLVGFASINAWTDRNGGFVIAGQVVNNATQAIEFVRITAELFNEADQPLVQQDDFVSSDLLLPGEYAPFSIVFPDGLLAGTVRYDMSASARYADFAAQTFYGPSNFDLTSEATFDENGLLVVQGLIRNKGTSTANLIKVIVTVFDEQRRVIATDTTLIDQQRLAPSETSSYAVSFVELGGSPANFQVTAQGIIEP